MNHARSQSKASSHHSLDLSEKLFRIDSLAREHLSTKPCQCPLVWLQTIVSLGPLLCGAYSCWPFDCCLKHAEAFTMDLVTGSSGPNEWVDNSTVRTLHIYIYSTVEMLRVGRLHYGKVLR